MQSRRPAGATADRGAEETFGDQQADGTGTPSAALVQQPSVPARSTVKYVPFPRAPPPDAVRTDDVSERILKYVLTAGTLLLVVLFGASMADSYLGGAAPPSTPAPTPTPVVTDTPGPATPVITSPSIPSTVQTRLAGTLSPYSVDPNSVTPDPDATVYVAPGYRVTFGETVEPGVTGAETGSNGAYATPPLLIVVTPVISVTAIDATSPVTITAAPTTAKPTTVTVATTRLTPSTSAATTVLTAVPTTTKPASANSTITKTPTPTTLPTGSPTVTKTTVPIPSVQTATTAPTPTATGIPTVLPTTAVTTPAGNVSP